MGKRHGKWNNDYFTTYCVCHVLNFIGKYTLPQNVTSLTIKTSFSEVLNAQTADLIKLIIQNTNMCTYNK